MAKRCKRCNYANENSSHYCSQCGTPLEKETGRSTLSWKYYCVEPESEYYGMKNELLELKQTIQELKKEKNV